MSPRTRLNETRISGRAQKEWMEHGCPNLKAAAWRSNAAWLAGRPSPRVLSAVSNRAFLPVWTYVTGKAGPQLIVKHRGGRPER